MPKNVRRFPKIMSEEELRKLIQTILTSNSYQKNVSGEFLRARDAACISLLYYCGLRPGEALGLEWKDIDFERRLIKIDPSSNKERNDISAVISLPAFEILLNYHEALKELNISSEFLFPSLWTWQPLRVDSFGRRLRALMREAGILLVSWHDQNGTPRYNYRTYTFRHNFLTKVYKKFHDSEAVTQLGRHTQPSSAHVYIHLSEDDKKDMVDKVF